LAQTIKHGVCFTRDFRNGTIASDALALRYGIELDAYRAEQARQTTPQVIQGDACSVHCPVESFSLLYLNPPYDFESGDGQKPPDGRDIP
jgi:hypothetical protein